MTVPNQIIQLERISLRFNVIDTLDELFVGRHQELHELHTVIQCQLQPPTICAICGEPGIGKTALARQYITLYSYDYDDNIFWINAANSFVLIDTFRHLSNDLLNMGDNNRELSGGDIRELVDNVFDFFENRRCLFVFDNVENISNLEPYLPSLSATGVYVLVIMHSNLQSNEMQTIPLRALSMDESIELVRRSLRPRMIDGDDDDEQIRRLSSELCYCPLALIQALAYIKCQCENGSFGIDDYMKELKTEENKFFHSGNGRYNIVSIHEKAVLLTGFMSVNQIQKNEENVGQLANRILDVIAHFSSEHIPINTLISLGEENEIVSAIDLLAKYSLVKFADSKRNQIQVHRLTKKMTKIKLKRSNLIEEALRNSLNIFQFCTDIEVFSKSIQHAIATWNYAMKYINLVKEFNRLPIKIISVLIHDEKLMEAEVIGKKAMKALQVLGLDHVSTLIIMSKCAEVSCGLGKLEEALTVFNDVLERRIQLLGLDHPSTIKTKYNIASVLYKLGYLDKALLIYEEELDRNIRVQGMDHPNNLKIKRNISRILQMKGRRDEALVTNEKNAINTNTDSIMRTKITESRMLQKQGKYVEAVTVNREILEVGVRTYGKYHPQNLLTKRRIAKLLMLQGCYDKALIANEEVLEDGIQILGQNHIGNLLTRRRIAALLQYIGRTNEAIAKYEQVLDESIKLLGENHPDIVAIRRGMAYALRDQGKHEAAINAYQDLLKTGIEQFGANHPANVITKRCIAALKHENGQLAEAQRIYQEVLEESMTNLGANHRDHLITKRGIAAVYQAQEKYEEALALYEEILQNGHQHFGENHPDNLMTKRAIATVLFQCQQNREHIEVFKDCDSDTAIIDLVESTNNIKIKRNVAESFGGEPNPKKPLNPFKKLKAKLSKRNSKQNIIKATIKPPPPPPDPDKYGATLRAYKDVLEKGEVMLGHEHPDNLITQCCIAAVLQEQGKYEEAMNVYQEVLLKRTRVLGAAHPDILVTRRAIAALLQKLGRYDEAYQTFQDILEKGAKILGEDHADNVLTRQHMTAVLRQKAKFREVVQSFEEERKRAANFNTAFLTTLLLLAAAILYLTSN